MEGRGERTREEEERCEGKDVDGREEETNVVEKGLK